MLEGLPKKLKILASLWKVELSTKAELEDATGKTWPNDNKIRIARDQAPGELCDTAWHEISHAIWWSMGISEDGDEKLEEKIVRKLCTGQLAAFVDNPDLLRWLADYCDSVREEYYG